MGCNCVDPGVNPAPADGSIDWGLDWDSAAFDAIGVDGSGADGLPPGSDGGLPTPAAKLDRVEIKNAVQRLAICNDGTSAENASYRS
jgi:hypothetical protein